MQSSTRPLIKSELSYKFKYIHKYIEKINSGEIIVGDKIIKQFNKIDHYAENYYIDGENVDKKINFVENECHFTKGSNAKIKLSLFYKVIFELIFGIYKIENKIIENEETGEKTEVLIKTRVIHELPIIMARSNGKSFLTSLLALIFLMIEGEPGAEILVLATTKDQADIVYGGVKDMINLEETGLFKLKEKKLLKTTKSKISFIPTNSTLTIKAANYKTLDGTNSNLNIFDEVHAYTEDVIKIINDGSEKKRKNWLSVYISTNGNTRGKVFDKYYKIWSDIVNDIYDIDSIFPLIYEIDGLNDISEIEKYPEKAKNFQKANPMINIIPTLTTESLINQLIKSRADIHHQNEFLAKSVNYPVEGFNSFFSNDEIKGNSELFDENIYKGESLENMKSVIIGVDLAEVLDIASFSLMTVKDNKHYFKTFNFLPRQALNKMSIEKKQYMKEQSQKGNLILHDKEMNDTKEMFEYVINYLKENNIRILALAYDPWGDKKSILDLMDKHYPYADVVKIRQNSYTFTEPLKIYKNQLQNKKIIFNDELLTYAHSNVKVDYQINGQMYPKKNLKDEKIDAFMASMDAFICYRQNKEKYDVIFNL